MKETRNEHQQRVSDPDAPALGLTLILRWGSDPALGSGGAHPRGRAGSRAAPRLRLMRGCGA